MRDQCNQTILQYVPQARQTNAHLFGEHHEFVALAITLLRDRYHHLLSQGETVFTVEQAFIDWYNENKPWEEA